MTARTVLHNGKPRRFVLLQPLHYRTGQAARPVVDTLLQGVDVALRNADRERAKRSKGSGARAVTV